MTVCLWPSMAWFVFLGSMNSIKSYSSDFDEHTNTLIFMADLARWISGSAVQISSLAKTAVYWFWRPFFGYWQGYRTCWLCPTLHPPKCTRLSPAMISQVAWSYVRPLPRVFFESFTLRSSYTLQNRYYRRCWKFRVHAHFAKSPS